MHKLGHSNNTYVFGICEMKSNVGVMTYNGMQKFKIACYSKQLPQVRGKTPKKQKSNHSSNQRGERNSFLHSVLHEGSCLYIFMTFFPLWLEEHICPSVCLFFIVPTQLFAFHCWTQSKKNFSLREPLPRFSDNLSLCSNWFAANLPPPSFHCLLTISS